MANSSLDNYYISTYGPSGTNSLKHFYPGSDASGAVIDLIAGLNGTAGAGITYGQPSILPTTDGKTCLQSSTTSASNIALASNLGGAPLSYELWVRPVTLPSANSVVYVQNGGAANGHFFGAFYVLNRIAMFDSGGTFVSYASWSPVIGTSYHLVMTCNGTAATTIIYINSVVQTMTQSSSYAAPSTANASLLGSNTSTRGPDAYGEKIAIYNAVLTPTQITNNYNAGLNGIPSTGNVLIPPFSGGMQELSGNIRG